MSEPSGDLWLAQATSDWRSALRIFDSSDHLTYCQTIAKYQQTVEKSVKAVFASVKDKGINLGPLGYDHDVAKKIAALKRLPQPTGKTGIQFIVNRVFTNADEINVLCALAPKKPAPGQLHARNTEYPFEIAAGLWEAPATKDVFSLTEVNQFRRTAEQTFTRASKAIDAIKRAP